MKLYIIEFVKAAYSFVQISNEKCYLVALSVCSMKGKVIGCDNRYNRS